MLGTKPAAESARSILHVLYWVIVNSNNFWSRTCLCLLIWEHT